MSSCRVNTSILAPIETQDGWLLNIMIIAIFRLFCSILFSVFQTPTPKGPLVSSFGDKLYVGP